MRGGEKTSSNLLGVNKPVLLTTQAGPSKRDFRFARLKPGFSPLDWARLKSSGKDLRGVTELSSYTLEQVAQHNTRKDCWMVLFGKVYNVTDYLPFHPGGKGELMRGAGKDGTKLFLEYHSWVNPELMLDKCLVGFLR
ncbi:hypothetical protein AYI70_g10626 [Smittium culicis]|uniref:Cytochrome b5 heme-binding domain-containing protein n=1 Tax=Smittium culicis TaxID=133412 RepID=A0A1R1X5Q2_9FUNG|nr:hypothetical protein AYI70_g10626 [Smittium culicis]